MSILSQIQYKKLAASILLSAFALNSQAAIIDNDSYFTDTETGLIWLDVSITVNRSFNDISSQFIPGGEFDGWRYATGVEFNNLLSSWTGVASISSGRTETTGTTPSVDGLVTLFGSTLDVLWNQRFGQTWDSQNGYNEGEGIDFTLGIIADSFDGNINQRQVAALWDNEQNGPALDFYNINHRQVIVSDPKSDIGSFLVRGVSNENDTVTSVSEPNTIFLLALGLLGLGLGRRNREKYCTA
tara:strand:+ start:2461 stop:3186 length:726 start_codon:yes stop_codon:yes gene_type:complete